MNTYSKYVPNVFLAKCTEPHEKGETILVQTKYGKENECIVFNHIKTSDGFYFYSIVRADGFNVQEYAKKKAERILGWAASAENKSNQFYEASKEGADFLKLAEPIKIGHHSEKRHRALIERNYNRMGNCVKFSNKAKEYESRAQYWENRKNIINLSMPESVEYYEYELEKAKMLHEGYKGGTIKRTHSFSLVYAKKAVNEMETKLKLARQLWG